MSHAFVQLASSSASRSNNTRTYEQTQPSVRTTQSHSRVPAVTQSANESEKLQSTSARRRVSNQTALNVKQHVAESQLPSPERGSPAYLQGKNPYGRVVDKVEHPYRESRHTAITDGPPSQVDSSFESRPRTSGSLQFKTRPAPLEPERMVAATTSQPPLIPTRQLPKSVSVQAAKIFFETKAFQNRSGPLPPAGVMTVAKEAPTIKQTHDHQQLVPPPGRSMHISSPVKIRASQKQQPGEGSPPQTTAADPQRANPFARHKAEPSAPKAAVQAPTAVLNPPNLEDTQSGSAIEHELSRRRRSTKIFTNAPRDSVPLSFDLGANGNSSKLRKYRNMPLLAIEKTRPSNERRSSEGSVKRHSSHRSTSFAEAEAVVYQDLEPTLESRHNELGQSVRAIEDDELSPSRQLRRRRSRSAPLVEQGTAGEPLPRRRSTKSSTTDLDGSCEICHDNFGEHSDVRSKIQNTVARVLSHDGSSSNPSISRRSTAPGRVPIADIGVQKGYHDIEVPDHVDMRGAYGRRQTQDFGFPGARIKPRRTIRTYKPLADPDSWIKRACGHFSTMSKSENPEHAYKRSCQQCSAKAALPHPRSSHHHWARKRAVTDSSTSCSSSSKRSRDACGRSAARRQHHSDCMPADQCGDTFAKDLGYIIDAILEEHANTLQGVIKNIKHSQPNITQLRKVSDDLVQRCQAGGVCTNQRHVPRRLPCTHQAVCQPVCQPCQPCQPLQPVCGRICKPVCKSQTCEWMPPCPYIPPKVAEKLNVGLSRQLSPTMNDSQISLQESIQSAPQLVDLLNSAADDLGLDLDTIPTVKDEEIFLNAPTEGTHQASRLSCQDSSPQSLPESTTDNKQPSEDAWLQQTRRHLTELSEARTQLMDELDSIAEDLGVQLQERRVSEPDINQVQRGLSKVSTGLSRRSTRLRNKSVDSVAGEIPRMIAQRIDERRLNRLLTRASTESRRMSATTQDIREVEDISPDEIQYWLQVAHNELPAAIDSIATVLETLPALDFEPVYEQQFEEAYGQYYDLEPDHDDESEPELYEEYARSLPHRSYTEPINNLQDRIADLERRWRVGSLQVDSPQNKTDNFTTPMERTVTPDGDIFKPSVQTMAEEELREVRLDVGRIGIRRTTLQPLKDPTSILQNEPDVGSFSSESYEDEGCMLEPVERTRSRRKSSNATRQRNLESDRAPSSSSLVMAETEEPLFKQEQKFAESGLDMLSPQSTRCSTTSIPSLVLSTDRVMSPVSSALHKPLIDLLSARRSTMISSEELSMEELQHATTPSFEREDYGRPDEGSLTSDLDEPKEEKSSFQPSAESISRSTTSVLPDQLQGVLKPSLSVSSLLESVAEDVTELPVVPRPMMRSPTRKIDIPEADKELKFPIMRTIRSMRQSTQRNPVPEAESDFERSVTATSSNDSDSLQSTRKDTMYEAEPVFEPPKTRITHSMTKKYRRQSTKPPSPIPEVYRRSISRISTRHESEGEPVVPAKRNTQATTQAPTRKLTHMQTNEWSLEESEQSESLARSLSETMPIATSSRQNMTGGHVQLERKVTTVEMQAPLLSEGEFEDISQISKQRGATRVSKVYTSAPEPEEAAYNESVSVFSELEPAHEPPEDETTSDSENASGIDQVRQVYRTSTQPVEVVPPNASLRKPPFSTQALTGLSATVGSRKASMVASQPSRQPTISSRRLTIRERTPPTSSSSTDEAPPAPVLHRTTQRPINVARQPTTTKATSPSDSTRLPTRRSTKYKESPSAFTNVAQRVQDDREYESDDKEGEDLVQELPTEYESLADVSAPEESIVISRKHSAASKKPTRVLTNLLASVDDEPTPLMRHVSTRTSHQLTEVPGAPIPVPLSQDALLQPDPQLISAHSSLPDNLFTAHDVLDTSPTHAPESFPHETQLAVEGINTRRGSTVRVANDLTATCSHSSPGFLSRQSTANVLVRQPSISKQIDELTSESSLAIETTQHNAEGAFTMPTEDIAEEEPGRLDRASTADLSRDPESLATPAKEKIAEALLRTHAQLEHRKTRPLPEIDERVRRVMIVPKRSSAAPDITATPSELIPRDLKHALPFKKSKKAVNYPPEQQYPSAPPYPLRDTPLWTKPDTYTTPVLPKTEPIPKKRGIFGWVSKPREQSRPIQSSVLKSEPEVRRPLGHHHDRHPVEPFRYAAPGPVPGPSGGTLQRPRIYRDPPGHDPFHTTKTTHWRPVPIPARGGDHLFSKAPIYARKDDYYPRLAPIVQNRGKVHPQPQKAPIQRNIYSKSAPIPAPLRRAYPSPGQQNYPEAQARAGPTVSYRNEPRQPSLRSQAPESNRHQFKPQQASRNPKKASRWFQAPPPQRRPQNYEESVRPRPAPQDKGIFRFVHKDVNMALQAIQKETPGPTRGIQGPKMQGEVSRRLEEGQSREQKPGSKMLSSARGNGESNTAPGAETSSENVLGNISSENPSQDEEDNSPHHSADDTDGRSSLEIPRERLNTSANIPRTKTHSAQDRPSNDQTRRQSSALVRTPSPQATRRRESSITGNSLKSQSVPALAARSPSTALERTKTQHRPSVTGLDNTGGSRPQRTTTVPWSVLTGPQNIEGNNAGRQRLSATRMDSLNSETAKRGAETQRRSAHTQPQQTVEPAIAKPGAREQPVANEKATNERAKPISQPQNAEISRRRSSVPKHLPSFSGPKAIPRPQAAPNVTRKDSFKAPSSPTKRLPNFWVRGKGQKESGAQQQLSTTTKGYDTAGSGGAGTIRHSAQTVEAKVVQGGGGLNPLKGQWGWAWGKG